MTTHIMNDEVVWPRDLLTRGNTKLGPSLIWSWSIPAVETCPGSTPICRKHCYATRLASYRPSVLARYRRNLALVRHPEFVERMVECVHRRACRVVRIHQSGDLFSNAYITQWQRIIRSCPATQFFTYTRSWRESSLRRKIEHLACLPNLRLWYSTDKDSGLPGYIPETVKLAWMMASDAGADQPPQGTDIAFRVQSLRKIRQVKVRQEIVVCPAEAGLDKVVTCDQCQLCLKPATGRIAHETTSNLYSGC